MKSYPLLTGIALIVFAALAVTPAPALNTTPNATVTTVATTTAAVNTTPSQMPEQAGASIYFETYPPGATIWLDNENIGTSPFNYFTEKTGVRQVRIWKKGYENYTTTLTVTEGKMDRFYARLTEAPRVTPVQPEEEAPVVTVKTVVITTKPTVTVPTPWATTPESPVDPGVACGAVALGAGLVLFRRR